MNFELINVAFDSLQQEVQKFPGEGFSDRLEQCRTEFRYMADFMLQGYQDKKRNELFADLQQRLRDLWYDIRVRKDIIETPYIKGIYKTLTSKDTSAEMLQSLLLTTTDAKEHCDVLTLAFLSLYTSYHWRTQQVEEWLTFLTSAQTNPIDSATLTSAIAMSCLQHFSRYKAQCLANIYDMTADENVRQRAFVGLLLAFSYATQQEQKENDDLLATLLAGEKARKDLLEMQMQMASCANADKDSTEIRRNLMPNIMRNQPFTITKDGIEEREDEDDSLDPDAADRRMEEMEESVKKMLKMQKNGADIFFEGFSQMKRYPFFYKMANWFMPFYMQHPDIATYTKGMENTEFIDRVTKLGPFCNSDKYSFVIAFSTVMNQLPEKVREMMKSGDVGPIGMHKEGDDMENPSLLRLQYMQDLYRFFRLNPIATNIQNPYNDTERCKPWLIAAHHLGTKELYDMCKYLLKHGGDEALKHVVPRLLNTFEDKDCIERCYCIAQYRMLRKEYATAVEYYNKCLTMKPGHKGSMHGVAKAYYANGNYKKAAFYFDALHTLYPDRTSFALNYAMAMVKDGKASDVTNELYRMEYENPDDEAVRNTLGWALLHAGKAEQALSLYEKRDVTKSSNDFSLTLNHAYALLFNGKAQDAVALLRQFCEGRSATEPNGESFQTVLMRSMKEDMALLSLYGMGMAEANIIVASV